MANMHTVQGGCHCGNITYVAEFTKDLSTYTPRACDCNLCASHGAAYASDRNGSLKICIRDRQNVNMYRQGSRIADFIICKQCGVLTGACYKEEGRTFGSINVRSSNAYNDFNEGQSAQLEQLSDEERIERWKRYWFTNIVIEYEDR